MSSCNCLTRRQTTTWPAADHNPDHQRPQTTTYTNGPPTESHARSATIFRKLVGYGMHAVSSSRHHPSGTRRTHGSDRYRWPRLNADHNDTRQPASCPDLQIEHSQVSHGMLQPARFLQARRQTRSGPGANSRLLRTHQRAVSSKEMAALKSQCRQAE